MIEYRWRQLAAGCAAVVLAGCSAPSGNAGSEKATTDRTASTMPTAISASAFPASRQVPGSGAASPKADGVALPRATAAPSALFNAAYQRVEDHWEQILFLCDGVGGDRVQLITVPNANGLSELFTYRKPDFRTIRETVRLGDDDPGAGQIMRAIERSDGTPFGSVHSINPGVMGDAKATTMPTLSSITDKNETTQCRWEPRSRILLVDPKRAVLVTADAGDGYTYKSFDYAKPGKMITAGGGATNIASTTIRGGRLVPADPGHEIYEFRNGPWTYRVAASADNTAPAASLTVLRDGKPIQTSVAAAYQMAAKRTK